MADDEKDIRKQKAVALQYDMDSMPAPKVIAKGQGYLAQQIVELAEEKGIEIHQDASLVEILSVLEMDSFIPLEAYAAVAEILSYIYRQNAAQRHEPGNTGGE